MSQPSQIRKRNQRQATTCPTSGFLPIVGRGHHTRKDSPVPVTEHDQEAWNEKRAQILEALRAGPISTFDIEQQWHRGQAVIRDLRQRGYGINLIGKFYNLVSEPDLPRVKVTESIKEMYYETSHWAGLREARRKIDGYACQQCKEPNKRIEVHHWRYRLFEENIQEDLITLCHDCHEYIHDCAAGSEHIHFPHFLEPELYERILREGSGHGTN
jgi:hypothetical protein